MSKFTDFFKKVGAGIKKAAVGTYDKVLKPVYTGVIKPIGGAAVGTVTNTLGAAGGLMGAIKGAPNIFLYAALGVAGVVGFMVIKSKMGGK